MTETAEKLKLELAQLSSQDRAELASFLIHSLDEESEHDVESAWDIELTRRMQEINEGSASGQPAIQVFAELREKYL
jgi:putative addiction module component (TIGR02574 family)